MKDGQKGRENRKEDRKFGEGFAGDSREEHEHKDKVTSNQIFIQNILSLSRTIVCFIEDGGWRLGRGIAPFRLIWMGFF